MLILRLACIILTTENSDFELEEDGAQTVDDQELYCAELTIHSDSVVEGNEDFSVWFIVPDEADGVIDDDYGDMMISCGVVIEDTTTQSEFQCAQSGGYEFVEGSEGDVCIMADVSVTATVTVDADTGTATGMCV